MYTKKGNVLVFVAYYIKTQKLYSTDFDESVGDFIINIWTIFSYVFSNI